MRRLIPWVVAAALVFAAEGCKRPQPRVDTIEDGNRPAQTAVHAASTRSEAQLLGGFHSLETNSRRWTESKFSFILQPPEGAAGNGARLELKFDLPPQVIARRKAVTLHVTLEGHSLAPETYTKPGEHAYLRPVAASAFRSGPVIVDCALDKYLAAGEIERRELGIVFRSAALLPE